ncbi:hypothetical protein BJ122_102206 [Rhodopseudomonas faecalis]|uniref:Uncharacterized protein n=1 Tax=Rhodopseudomonas faecalis TaxID=99655 RepID=A0A318TM92_9BRAD|nr:hypothetical protein [Rhodopseudomonas faecalis]PYF04980.1 hypothetical protein BJ122_102206 [Rhodopseudomonas faecalis]
MANRRHIPLKIKLAAALLQMKRPDDAGRLVPVIPHDEAKRLTADQIVSRFEFNHYPIPHAAGGPDEPWNLDPMPKADHRERTAKIDIPAIAKTKRVAKAQEEFRRRLLAKGEPDAAQDRPARKSKWPSRRFGRAKWSNEA